MRKYYLDNIRWMTVILVVVYHVIYMYNAEGILGGVGKITNLQVKEIALSLGFDNVAFFNRFFKARVGVTPKAFRNA